jgi:TonB family protein
VPLKQPLPRLDDLRNSGTVRLRLTVSDDGRVKEIDVLQGLSGATADVVDAVRKWRFKPATLNGQPVQGTFEAEIMLNGQR